MKIENPMYRCQVQVVRGDCSLPNVGIDEADVNRIKSKINIVIHLAATTTNNNPTLHAAVCTNVRATRDLVVLIKRFQNLKVSGGSKAKILVIISFGHFSILSEANVSVFHTQKI